MKTLFVALMLVIVAGATKADTVTAVVTDIVDATISGGASGTVDRSGNTLLVTAGSQVFVKFNFAGVIPNGSVITDVLLRGYFQDNGQPGSEVIPMDISVPGFTWEQNITAAQAQGQRTKLNDVTLESSLSAERLFAVGNGLVQATQNWLDSGSNNGFIFTLSPNAPQGVSYLLKGRNTQFDGERLNLQINYVPEPSSATLALIVIPLLLHRRRARSP